MSNASTGLLMFGEVLAAAHSCHATHKRPAHPTGLNRTDGARLALKGRACVLTPCLPVSRLGPIMSKHSDHPHRWRLKSQPPTPSWGGRRWRPRRDSNARPFAPQANALSKLSYEGPPDRRQAGGEGGEACRHGWPLSAPTKGLWQLWRAQLASKRRSALAPVGKSVGVHLAPRRPRDAQRPLAYPIFKSPRKPPDP